MLLITWVSQAATACGGFACNFLSPVLQTGEQVVLAIDEQRNTIDMHVQVAFDGTASDFAWIVPVPGVPELRLSTGVLFSAVAATTAPTFSLNTVPEGHCREPFQFGWNEYNFGSQLGSLDEGGVTVLGATAVGPYQTVTLAATSPGELLDWLQAEGYDLPDSLEGTLAPYLADGQHFVALKLAPGNDVGDLQPLALRMNGSKASIPIQLTAISTIDELPIQVYVFSSGRAVPESYLHVRLNDAAIDWWAGGTNLPSLITKAANEAGGQAFLTGYHGSSDRVGPLWLESAFDEAALRDETTHTGWLDALNTSLVTPTPELFTLLEELWNAAPGDGSTIWSCPTCLPEPTTPFDAATATDALITGVVEPLREVQALIATHPKLTAMWTTMDAFEMTTDPTFVVNHDLADEAVSNTPTAALTIHCGNGRRSDRAPRTLDLADGRAIELRSEEWFARNKADEFSSLGPMADIAAQVVEQMGATGEPEVLTDRTDELWALVDTHNRTIGCRVAPEAGGLEWVLAALLVTRRRRDPAAGRGA